MSTYVVGDIHGNYKALRQVIERSGFECETDTLICLGDYVDGLPESKEVIEYLSSLSCIITIRGNHDAFFRTYLKSGLAQYIWVSQGGRATIESYGGQDPRNVPQHHVDFIDNTIMYHIDNQNRLFVHGGIKPYQPLVTHSDKDFMWDRDLFNNALDQWYIKQNGGEMKEFTEYNRVFIGHTSTYNKHSTPETPIRGGEVWMLDQGAGWDGRLTIMDVDTEEYWQSDTVGELYPDAEGR